VILVGDGRSDYCLARRADFVLAKGSLAVFCTAEGIPHHTITGFADILGMLDSLFTAAPRSDLPRHSVNLGGLHA
jgi:2-hydroxy-3-keto-5-methylthiopentenyl-1-phosphate phosphatase